jgi:hypothetical protein
MRISTGEQKRAKLIRLQCVLVFLFICAASFYLNGCAATDTTNKSDTVPVDIPLLENWNGDYPVSELGRLPEGQQDKPLGYLGDTESFSRVWDVFMPEEDQPVVDFGKNIVVFTRNIQFYNRTSILKVELRSGTAEVLAMQTMSALPIKDKVAMAMAVIPRGGIVSIGAGTEKVEIINH